MVICTLRVVNVIFAYYKLLKHVTIELGTTFHKLIRVRVKTMALAHNSHKKSLIKVIVANRNA